MNLGNRFVNVIQKSLFIDIQLNYKEDIGIIFMETALYYKPHFQLQISRSKHVLSMKIVKKITFLIESYFQG